VCVCFSEDVLLLLCANPLLPNPSGTMPDAAEDLVATVLRGDLELLDSGGTLP